MFNRTLNSLLAASALLAPAATLTARADAKGYAPPTIGHRYLLYVSGAQTTTADQPVHGSSSDCFHVYTGEAHASESISFHSNHPEKVVIDASGPTPTLTWGWNPLANIFAGDLKSSVSRQSRSVQYDRPGRCGGGGPTITTKGKDCGTRRPEWDAMFGFEGKGRVELSAAQSDYDDGPAGSGYEDCGISAPMGRKGIEPNVGAPTRITAHLSSAELRRVKKGGRVVTRASESFDSCGPGADWASCRQHIHWTLRLLRVK